MSILKFSFQVMNFQLQLDNVRTLTNAQNQPIPSADLTPNVRILMVPTDVLVNQDSD
jgi:hypothetical protein